MEIENSTKIEVHRRTGTESEEENGDESDQAEIPEEYRVTLPEGQSSFETESEEEVELEQRQLAYPPLPVYKSPIPSPSSSRNRVGLLTPTEELSEGEPSVIISSIKTYPTMMDDPTTFQRVKPSPDPSRRVTFDPLGSPRRVSISPDPLDDVVDAHDLELSLEFHGDGIEDLIELQSRQELVLNWQEKHQQHLIGDEVRDILQQSSSDMDPSIIMKSLRTLSPSNLAPMVQQMTESLTAYQSHLSILNTISLFGDRLRELQPFEYNLDLLPLLKKLCSLAGESKSSSPDLSSAVTLSKLIRGAGPALITEDLLYIINGSNLKRKPAAMDGLTYALLTFPRDDFDLEKIAEAVSHCLWDSKRRVRQAALECLAVVAHVLGPGIAMPFLRELIEQNRPVDTTENPSSAVSARVSRRLLPSTSSMGLIEYGLSLPSKQFTKGNFESLEANGGLDPIPSKGDFGPDILWILHGTAEHSKINSARSSLSSRHGTGTRSKSSRSAVIVSTAPEIDEDEERQEESLRQKHRSFLVFQEKEREKEKFEQEELERKYETDFNLNDERFDEGRTTVRDRDSGVSSLKSLRIASPAESTSSSKSPIPDEGGECSPMAPLAGSPPSTGQSDDFVLRRPVLPRSSRTPLSSTISSQTGRVQHSPPPMVRSPISTPVLDDDTEPNMPSTSQNTEQKHWLKKSCPTKIPPRKSKSRPGHGATVPAPSIKSPQTGALPVPSTSRSKETPKHLLANALTQLSSPEWEVTVDGFGALTRLLHMHPEYLKSELVTVNRAALLHLSNLRSQVTRAACNFFEELFVNFGKSMEQDCEKIAEKLLDKTADTNKFIREASTSALESMAMHLPPSKTLVILENHGAKHRNTIVRCTTAHVTRLLVQQLGPERALHQNPQKILPLLIRFLQEGSLETRTHAKHGLAYLVVHGSFEPALKRYIPSSTLKQVEKSISAIKHDLIRKG